MHNILWYRDLSDFCISCNLFPLRFTSEKRMHKCPFYHSNQLGLLSFLSPHQSFTLANGLAHSLLPHGLAKNTHKTKMEAEVNKQIQNFIEAKTNVKLRKQHLNKLSLRFLDKSVETQVRKEKRVKIGGRKGTGWVKERHLLHRGLKLYEVDAFIA